MQGSTWKAERGFLWPAASMAVPGALKDCPLVTVSYHEVRDVMAAEEGKSYKMV